MERLEVVQARAASIAQLQEVVGALRSLAAVRMQQAAEMLAATRRYADIVTAALGQALRLSGGARPRPVGPAPLLVFAPEHGFVGGYTDALVQAVLAAAPPRVIVIGARGAQALTESGHAPAWSRPMAAQAASIPLLARRLAADLAELAPGPVEMMFGRLEDGARWRIVRETLLPPPCSAPASGAPPLHHLPADQLVSGLVEAYALAALTRAATESLAAENAARLQAMTTASDNIDHKLAELQGQERILRQERITDELLDVINGAEQFFEQE